MCTSTPQRRSSGAHRQVSTRQAGKPLRSDPAESILSGHALRAQLDGELTAGERTLAPAIEGRRRAYADDVVPMPAPKDPAPNRSPEMEMSAEHTAITGLLADLRAGKREAFDQMLPLVYNELRRTARRELAARPSDTLSTTALVHELYLKFARAQQADWQNRAHFLGVASVAMRHILVDRARRRRAGKRGGPQTAVTLDEGLVGTDPQADSLLELHEALDRLALLDPRLARVVECRFFGGMTELETAEALSVTERTVRRDWVKARGLLYQALGPDASRALARPDAPASP